MASLAFYHFSQTHFISSIKHEHSCKILYMRHELYSYNGTDQAALVTNVIYVSFSFLKAAPLTHLCQLEFPALIKWMNPFQNKGVVGL